jgi:hypothetical protein
MSTIVFTAADFDLAINITLNGLNVDGRSVGLSATERASMRIPGENSEDIA